MAKKKEHGGKRPGAGRPILDEKQNRRKPYTFTIQENLVEQLDARRKELGISRSEAMNQALKLWLHSAQDSVFGETERLIDELNDLLQAEPVAKTAF